MKKMIMLSLAAALAIPFFGCEKSDKTPGQQLDQAIENATEVANDAKKEADKAVEAVKEEADKAADAAKEGADKAADKLNNLLNK